ncbi:phosphoribosylpyrophosphate synthetase [Taibaiella sp. KBW10]|uniref:phosphoribosylpyrophosphate synthetase n=1 Tax=Taibaiella sp. KBW10 TaxID=2153357 RepID=UPI000F5A5057|nr:phosphoribosylpyrophosphate synthetase [Taibaiella sp. KBW10]RQO32107.1 phosphoribosylpyrophosphate synthetase [Taibaiella sp. KBW10]
MNTYETLSQATNDLMARGYTLDFNLSENCLICNGTEYDVADFEIVEFHRFEGFSNPDDLSTVYVLESKDGRKGMLVTGYGISAEGRSAQILKRLKFRDGLH